MTRFVIAHGAWHDGQAWAPVREHLETGGHEVHTPTAFGLDGPHSRHVGLMDCTQSVVDYIVGQELRDFVLVGHSWGGYVISHVASQIPQRVRRLVFFNAFVPEHDKSLVDEIPPFLRASLTANAEERNDGTVMLSHAVWRDMFINDASGDLAQRAYEQLRPQPYRSFTDKADMSQWHQVTAPCSYINAYEDNDLTQGEWGRHPRLSNRLGIFRLVGLPGSHEVPITEPELSARKIIEAGSD